MSWDVSIQKFSRSYESISDIGEDEKGLPLGPRNVVHDAVSKIFPSTDWTDPAWGVWDSERIDRIQRGGGSCRGHDAARTR